MWVNPLFSAEARGAVQRLVSDRSLATLVVESPLRAAHLPLLLEEEGDTLTLVGHIPRADPLSKALAAGQRVLCIFHGPRAYVSAGWYGEPGLSTYNFSVAHLEGTAAIIDDPADVRAHLVALLEQHELTKPDVDGGPWAITDVAQARIDTLLPAVMGFRIRVDVAQAKTKFGQNRSSDDRVATREHLHRSADPEHLAVAELMTDAIDAPEVRRPGH